MNNLRLVEIELWSYCNRKCRWCPNSFIDRTEACRMNIDIFKSLIQSLKEIDYQGYITFSRYNEPLANAYLLRLACDYIKRELPKCTLVTNTNGDFFDSFALQNLNIDELSIMDYDNKGLDWCLNRLTELNCIIDEVSDPFIYAHYKNMKILYYTKWALNCTPGNRGGSLNIFSPVRESPCTEPQFFIGINYDGTVSPCCNIRNDIEKHQPYIIGDLNKNSLIEILESTKRNDFIRYCKNAKFDPASPCYTCSNSGGRYTRKNGGIRYE